MSISIHALRVEGDRQQDGHINGNDSISIHALRVEGDVRHTVSVCIKYPFLSTPSGWRATEEIRHKGKSLKISIHTLRVEGDSFRACFGFQDRISIHALRVEGDQ